MRANAVDSLAWSVVDLLLDEVEAHAGMDARAVLWAKHWCRSQWMFSFDGFCQELRGCAKRISMLASMLTQVCWSIFSLQSQVKDCRSDSGSSMIRSIKAVAMWWGGSTVGQV